MVALRYVCLRYLFIERYYDVNALETNGNHDKQLERIQQRRPRNERK